MNLKSLLFGLTAVALAAGGAVYASSYAATETSAPQKAASSLHIPGSLSLGSWTYGGGCKTENNDGNVGYVKTGANANVDFTCDETGVYEMAWNWSYAKEGNVEIVITDKTSGAMEIFHNWAIADGDQTVSLPGLITAGEKNIKFTITSTTETGYLGNYTVPTFTKVADKWEDNGEVPAGWDVIPGALDINKWTIGDGLRLEHPGSDANIGYTTNGGFATYPFYCTEAGVYEIDIDFNWFANAGDFIVTITDQATNKVEVNTTYTITEKHHAKYPLLGLITKGRKMLRVDAKSENGGYLYNWTTPTFNKIGDSFAMVNDITVADASIAAAEQEGYEFAFNVPADYKASTVVFTPEVLGATATVTADGVTVTDLGDGSYSIPTPAPNAETIVTIALNVEEGVYKDKEVYNVRFFRLGDVILAGVNVDAFALDEATVEALNNGEDVTVSDYIFTAVPEVTATFLDGSQATATSTNSGTKATYTFTGKAGNKTKSFTLTVNGIHLFTRAQGDKDQTVRYDGTFKKDDNSWNDGYHNIAPVNDGWGGTQFKFNYRNGQKVEFTAPVDRKIKQLVLAHLKDNYKPGKITAVTSEGATIWMPSASSFVNGDGVEYDLVINVENHTPGEKFEIEFENGDQPVWWFDYVYEVYVPTDAPVLKSSSYTDLTGKNHTVVSFTFNREVVATEVEFNGAMASSHVTGTTLNFPLWDLDFDTEYTLTLPAGAIKDTYNNATTEAYSVTFTTGKADYVEVHDADRFINVTTVDELRAAVAGLSATNGSVDAPTTIIYIHDGDYDLGTDDATAHIDLSRVYNVSIVGQSEEGVLIHGTRTGITNPILSTRDSKNIYMENFTVRNDLDFGAPDRVGVGVAHYGGGLDIMKNVTLQSIQDTQVTGERGYYYNVTIHGNVDYICGGGDHFYDHCTLVHVGEGGYITAPATSTGNKHGYVFSNCTIKGDSKFALGRPWQGEPRCYWLNTTMIATPSPEGWGGMSNLVTHFYEYNSMDANGNPIDLSKRKNSPTSTNTYSPILTAEEAAYFTHHNVLGYTDSWDPTELTAECEAPVVTYNATGLKWNSVANAAGYLVYVDGKATHFTTDTKYDFPAAPAAVIAREALSSEYKVAAISASGSHGTMSAAASDDTTGLTISTADADTQVEYFNIQGQRVDNPSTGVYIMRSGDTVKKVMIRK